MKQKDTRKLCESVLRKLQTLVNERGSVLLERDFGSNTMTVISGQSHTHVGTSDGDFDSMLQQLDRWLDSQKECLMQG